MNVLLTRALLALSLAATMVVLSPGAAHAAAPVCTDLSVGVPHNAVLPLSLPCSGGTGTGSPDALILSAPTKGAISIPPGGVSTDLWITYTPSPGQSGLDSFTYRGVSFGSGSGGSDELGPPRTVQLSLAPGRAPRCDSDSVTVPHNSGGDTFTTLFLACDSDGDPIPSYSLTGAPDHGSVDTTDLGAGILRYTPTAGYSGPDTVTFRATSTCGAASCQSAQAEVALTVLEDRTVTTTIEKLFVAAAAARLTTTSGRQVPVPFVVTTGSLVRLDVYRDGRRVDRTSRSVAAGRRTIVWDGHLGTHAARPDRYVLVLTATTPGQQSVDRSSLVLTKPR